MLILFICWYDSNLCVKFENYFKLQPTIFQVGTSQKLCKKTQTPVLDYAGTAHKAFDTGPPRIRPLAKYVS